MYNFIDKKNSFSAQLIGWYLNNKRPLPWRNTTDPYKIWLSEIILQQTRVAQGLAYYNKFVDHYPTVKDLADASEEEVLKDWQGLGYYSRARNLHAAAKFIQQDLKGKFPADYKGIKELKGIGDYTASAIASFAYHLPHAVVDGNVFRVLSRIFGIKTPIDSTEGKKEFKELAQNLMDTESASNHNQAIMEFGAIQCTPKSPDCNSCIFQPKCEAYRQSLIEELPVKEKKLKQRKRFLYYLIFEDDRYIIVNKRSSKGIWQNLYDFPMIEDSEALSFNQLTKKTEYQKLIQEADLKLQAKSASKKHILSHQILIAQFFHFRHPQLDSLQKSGFEKIEKKLLSQKPIPKLIENYLNEETNLLSLFKA